MGFFVPSLNVKHIFALEIGFCRQIQIRHNLNCFMFYLMPVWIRYSGVRYLHNTHKKTMITAWANIMAAEQEDKIGHFIT